MSLHSNFKVSPEMFEVVQVRVLAEPLKDIQRLVPKPRLHCLDCVLRKGEPSPQVLSALEQVLSSVDLALIPD